MTIPPLSTITRLSLLLPVALVSEFPWAPMMERNKKEITPLFTVLYEGPLLHDQNWTIKAGPVSPDNQKSSSFGGTCSMVPGDVSIQTGSGRDRYHFRGGIYRPRNLENGMDRHSLRQCVGRQRMALSTAY